MIFLHDKSKRWMLISTAAVAIIAVVSGLIIVARLNRSIEAERDRAAAGARVEVEQRSLNAPSTDGMTAFLSGADVRAIAIYKGTTYLATSGGLVRLDQGGSPAKRYTTLDGLPENDLTALAVFRELLFVGTSSSGLVSFDGNAFNAYSFLKPKATRISVLVPTEAELLIGTMDGGLFEFDGSLFTRRFNSTAGADFNRVTALLPYESRLYIGTQDAGLYVWREARIEHLSTREGLPSPRITGLVRLPSKFSDSGVIGVATDFGVVGLTEDNQPRPISSRPNITSLAVSGDRLLAGLFGGGIADLGADQKANTGTATSSGQSEATGLPHAPTLVLSAQRKLWALTTAGAFFREEDSAGPAFERAAAQLSEGAVLSSGHVTSIARDGQARLWVGYFDQGIDLISIDAGERLSHLQDERLREINFLRFDPDQDRMLAATSMGLVAIDGRLRQTVFTREQNGLVNNSVAHVSLIEPTAPPNTASARRPSGAGLLLATAGGLTEMDAARARSLTAFHGLASNHLYTSAVMGPQLFVGSLAGLVELEGLRVARTYKTSNSRLSHDWVTALVAANGLLFVGTNGGGVDELLPTGEWVNFSDEIGKFEVNQNAMHFDGDRLYVGTSDRGVLVYNTRDRRWTRISAGLTSQNVTAVTSDDRSIYIGTLNGLVRIEKRVIQ